MPDQPPGIVKTNDKSFMYLTQRKDYERQNVKFAKNFCEGQFRKSKMVWGQNKAQIKTLREQKSGGGWGKNRGAKCHGAKFRRAIFRNLFISATFLAENDQAETAISKKLN